MDLYVQNKILKGKALAYGIDFEMQNYVYLCKCNIAVQCNFKATKIEAISTSSIFAADKITLIMP